MRDEDVINCLPSGTITNLPGPMADAFMYITCILAMQRTMLWQKGRRCYPLSLVTGLTYELPVMYNYDIITHEEDAIVALTLVKMMDVSWEETFSTLCRRLP